MSINSFFSHRFPAIFKDNTIGNGTKFETLARQRFPVQSQWARSRKSTMRQSPARFYQSGELEVAYGQVRNRSDPFLLLYNAFLIQRFSLRIPLFYQVIRDRKKMLNNNHPTEPATDGSDTPSKHQLFCRKKKLGKNRMLISHDQRDDWSFWTC